jgi:uncharacterized membrane protein YphA (DoxX/SURF4 family)
MVTHTAKRLSRALVTIGAVSVVCSGVVAAHVRFVTDTQNVGEGFAFLADALTDPFNAAVLGGGALAVLVALGVYLRVQPLQRDIEVFRDVMTGYRDLLPWLLRLGFGLPLVGAGFAGYFFNPVVEPAAAPGFARLFQIGLGFALLFGVATRAAAIVGLFVYLLALLSQPLLLYSFEWVPGFIAIALVGSGRPSGDEVLQKVAAADGTVYGEIDPIHRAAAWLNRRIDPYERFVPTVIRVGMGLSFAFLGLFEKLLAPEMALSVVEKYELTMLLPVPAELWVLGAGFAELGLGVAIMFGFFTRTSAITALSVFVLTLFGIPDDPVLAHIGLFSLASALLITGAGAYAFDNRIGADKPAAARDDIVTTVDD